MSLAVVPVPRPESTPLPHPAARRVASKALLHEDDLFLALLRFDEDATIHEHAGEGDTTVICLEGAGFTSVGRETAAIAAGQSTRWPAGIPHRLWTEASTMLTLMVERRPAD